MKPYQITGEVCRHLLSAFKRTLNRYPSSLYADKRSLLFFRPESRVSGASFLRVDQLSSIAASLTKTRVGTEISSGDIVIGAKGTLDQLLTAKRAASAANVRFLYDPVDELLDLAKLRQLDGIIAASEKQYLWLRGVLPIPVFLLPHHVDLRIPAKAMAYTGFSLAYCGDPKNGFFDDAFRGELNVIEATQPHDATWATRLSAYSCHYCIRRKPEKSHSFKPPTKLFIAAHLGAAVITTRDESDAELLLPPDYPFFCESREPAAIAATIEFAREAWGTPLFEKAVHDVRTMRGWTVAEQQAALRLILSLA